MVVRAVVAQVPVTLDVQANVAVALEIVEAHSEADLIVFPEGFVSGYDSDLSWIDRADAAAIDSGIEQLASAASRTGIAVWLGTIARRGASWRNLAVGVGIDGTRFCYEKANLASFERGVLVAGDALPSFDVRLPSGSVRIGVQICRELRHPEQWRVLAGRGASLFVHLNNALAPEPTETQMWRGMLISRALENQRFVLSANAAGAHQRSPSMIVAPNGHVLAEAEPDSSGVVEATLDLTTVSNTYLEQIRHDLIPVTPDQATGITATPGSSLPSSSTSAAPPPVESQETSCSSPSSRSARAESAPPTTE